MPISYTKDNNEGTIQLFRKRLNYKVELARASYNNLVNFNFGEKFLFGRVNRSFVPMVVSETFISTKSFKLTNSAAQNISALPYVVDAFSDLAQQFKKCALLGKIDPKDSYLSNLKVYRAYQDPRKLYIDHRRMYFNEIEKGFRENNIRVKNFDEFIQYLMFILEKGAPTTPFTKPAFIKSRVCPILASGLAVEIADLDASSDQEKINQFVNSRNWDFYVNACASYGFMVDRFVPWRLVADIGDSPTRSPMLDYTEKYNLTTTSKIIDSSYKTIQFDYYKMFKFDLLSLYNRIKLRHFLETEECDGSTILKRVVPDSYTRPSFLARYSEQYFLKLYFKIRFFEEESQFTENQMDIMIDDCIEIYLQADLRRSLSIFEKILNKPFDYRGSVSYIIEHLKALKDAEFAESEGTTGASSGY
jgi:hypothetical protein